MSEKAKLQKSLQKIMDECMGDVQSLVIRAKHVADKPLKINTKIEMINGNTKSGHVIVKKLETLIMESQGEFKILTASITRVKDKGPRATIEIT